MLVLILILLRILLSCRFQGGRCGGAYFLFGCRFRGAFFLAVLAGAPFFCCRPRGALFFLCCRPRARCCLCCRRQGALLFLCCRPRGAVLFLAVVAGAWFFAVVPGGVLICGRCGCALFFSVVPGAGVHSLTGFLGSRTDNKNQHKATTAKTTRVPDLQHTPDHGPQGSDSRPFRKQILLVGQLHGMDVCEGCIMTEHFCINSSDHVLLELASHRQRSYVQYRMHSSATTEHVAKI